MKLKEFFYDLPKELIAQYPTERRSESRLMVLYKDREEIGHYMFRDIVKFVSEGDLLVFNRTKVRKSRLLGRRKTGGKVELLIFQDFPKEEFYALLKGKLKDEETIIVGDRELRLNRIKEGLFKVEGDGRAILEILERYGKVPLPPYIKREPTEIDEERYQTVFGEIEGAVAAPTAALHFDKGLLEELKKSGVEFGFVTLHVGIGTFLPIKSEDVEAHTMLPEYYEVPEDTVEKIEKTKERGKKVIFCGTTTVRAIESAAQKEGILKAGVGRAEIFIYPGYKFKVVEHMITNFHLPQSTPLLLVAALVGRERLLKAYNVAIREQYRFFSYGDAMLIL